MNEMRTLMDFGLPDPDDNRKTLQKLTDDSRNQQIGDWNGLILCKSGSYYFAYDPSRTKNKLVYLIKTSVKYWTMIDTNGITQVALWRDPSSAKARNLSQHVFFNVVVKDYKTVVTDTKQSDDGRRFWTNTIADTFARGLNLYLANVTGPRMIKQIADVNEFEQLDAAGEIWGPSQKFQARKLIISTLDLETTAKSDVKVK